MNRNWELKKLIKGNKLAYSSSNSYKGIGKNINAYNSALFWWKTTEYSQSISILWDEISNPSIKKPKSLL